MYGKRELTIENVRSEVNSYDLFKYYCAPFQNVNSRFCSELREDKHPTCCIQAYEGKFFYKDFATGESFDDIGYIKHKYGIDFKKALAYINRDFNLNLGGQNIEGLPTMQFFGIPDKEINVNDYIKESAKIEVQIRKWSIHDKSYWNERYQFSVKQLQFFRVFPLSYFWINSKIYSCKKNSYGYFMGTKNDLEKWKIYQPLEPKKKKWFSNIGKTDVQGYDQLPKTGNVIYITSSMKDVVTLRKLGFYAVAPSAESTIIPDDIIEELRSRFQKLIIFYDNDEPGIRASSKHAKLYSAQELSIPITAGVKDPSDFVDKYSYEELLKIMKNE